MPQLTRSIQLIDPHDGSEVDHARLTKFSDALIKYEQNFEKNLKVLKEALAYYSVTESVSLGGLLSRL